MTTQTIKLKFKDEAEMFSPFDPDQKQLSEDVITYLIRAFHKVHENNREQYILQLQFDTPVDHEVIKQKCNDYLLQERNVIKRSLRKVMLKAISLGIFGAAMLTLWFVLSANKESVGLEILSIVGWVSIWEAASIILIGDHEAREACKNFEKIMHAEIVILD